MPNMHTDFGVRSLARTRVGFMPFEVWTPPGIDTGLDNQAVPVAAAISGGPQCIAPVQAFAAIDTELTLTLQTAGNGMMVATGQPAIPIVPVFTQSNGAGIYDIEIKGLNQFGDPLTYRVQAASIAEFRSVVPCFSKYDYIKVTGRNAAAAAPETIQVGFTAAAGAGTRLKLPLPYKPRARTDVIQTASTQVSLDTPQFVMLVDAGGAVCAAPAAGIVTGALEPLVVAQTDIEHATIGFTFGVITQPIRPMKFLVFMAADALMSGRF